MKHEEMIQRFLPPGEECRDMDGIVVIGSPKFLSHDEDTCALLLRRALDRA